MTIYSPESKRVKIRITEKGKGVNIEAMQLLIKDQLNYNLDIITEEINEDIEKCKQEIEFWYKEGDCNMCLIQGIHDVKDEVKHLTKLREWKTFREEKYNWFEEQDLKYFVNLIRNNPDITYLAQYTGKTKDTKLITRRDLRDKTDRKIAKLYKQAVEKIEKCVEKENQKLKTKYYHFAIHPITVKIDYHAPTAHTYTHRAKEIKTFFIEDLSRLLKPRLKKQIDRVKFISEVFKYFYGLPKSVIDPDNIRKYC